MPNPVFLPYPGDPDRPIPVDVYPQNEEEWRERYERLWHAYLLGDYSVGDAKRYHLFRALDENGKEIDFVRRTFMFYRFITDTDVRGFMGQAGLTLEIKGERPADLVAGEGVWERSGVGARLSTWMRMAAAMGDYWLEAVRMEDGAVHIVGYDPRSVTPKYDTATGTRLEGATVRLDYVEDLLTHGTLADATSTPHTYVRRIDATGIEEELDGRSLGKKPHNLGTVPMVHLRWTPWDQPEHSLPAPHGIDQAVMRLDSFATQVGAISNRYGNPLLMVKGARLGAGTESGLFGRIFNAVPADADIKYVEAGATAVGPILDVMKEVIAHVRETSPEFLFAESSAQESGEARSYRASAFELKINEARSINLPELATITAYAVAMERNEVHVEGRYPFRIDTSPVLPRNLVVDLDILERASKWMTMEDQIRYLQARGIIGTEHDPGEYATRVTEERSALAVEFMRETPGKDPAV